MREYEQLAEEFLREQMTVYKRAINPLNRFLVKSFGRYLKRVLSHEEQIEAEDETAFRISNNKDQPLKIALITEEVGHLTGGRYYAWFIATALCEIGLDVTVYTNQPPVFQDNFKLYKQPEIKVITQKARELETIDIKADVYVGSPISGNIAAARLGEKYKKPSFAIIFDPFPMMEKYLGRRSYAGWGELVPILKKSNCNIISLCQTTSEFIYDWLNKRRDQVFYIHPCINNREKDLAKIPNKSDYVVFISRMVKHKRFDHVLQAVKGTGVKLKVISSVDGQKSDKMVESMGLKDQVEFCWKISDKEKFEIIYGARAVINGAIFEGFGLWAAEALACGVPVVCYDYPTLKEIQDTAGDSGMYFAEWDNPQSLTDQLRKCLTEKRNLTPTNAFNFEVMQSKIEDIFNYEPKIGVITIALNEEKFIAASLKSVIKYPNIKRVAVVEGAVNLFVHGANKEGLSIDNTPTEVLGVIKQAHGEKIVYERNGWATDKSALRNRALELLGKDIDYVLVVDADEVWKPEDLDKLVAAIKQYPHIGVFLFPHYHFWKQKDLLATGSNWNVYLFRCFKFEDKTLRWDRHEMPVVDKNGRYINKIDGFINLPEVHVYHYGYLKDSKDVLNKLEYYKKRDRHLQVKDTFTDWKQGDPTSTTHGGGDVIKFEGTHPDEVKNII